MNKIVQDSAIIREFKTQFSSITYKEHKKLEGLMNVYTGLLEKREKYYKEMPYINKKIKEKEAVLSN